VITNIDVNSDGVRLTAVPDLSYDVSYELDSNGDRTKGPDGNDIIIEPIPLFSFTGTEVTARK